MLPVMVRDLGESALASVLFLPLFFVPGLFVAWAADLARFRAHAGVERAAWGVLLSFALIPLLDVALATLGGLGLAVGLYWLLAAAGLGLLVQSWRRGRLRMPRDRYVRLAIFALAFWWIAALLQLVDLQWGHRLFVSVTVRDHCYRTAFIQAVLRGGVPPTNPLYYTGQPALMRNYYFWYVVCAVVCKATGLAARNVLVASCVWAAVAVFCAAALFCKYFLPPLPKLRRTALFSTLLFGVTGLDILMVAYLHFTPNHRFDADMEWWDPDHYPSWLDSFLYVPHHVASLAACLAALLLLWTGRAEARPVPRWAATALATIAFTSAFGLSIYVAFAFALTVLVWTAVLLLEKQRQLVLSLLISGASATILLVPFLLQLRGETATTHSKKAFPLTLQLRQLYGLSQWADQLTARSHFYAAHAKVLRTLLWCILVVPVTGAELGLFGFCGTLAWWRWRRGCYADHQGMRSLLVLTGGSLFSTMAVRSSITTINDYGMRTAMLPLFLLLILTAYLLTSGPLPLFAYGRSRPLRATQPGSLWLRRVATLLLMLGAVGTLYQALGIRFFLPLYEAGRLRDHRTNGAYPSMSSDVYQLRDAYAKLDRIAPPGAVVQYNPASIGSYFLYVNMLNVGHQVVSAEPGCGKSFGGDAAACPVIERSLDALYGEQPADAATAASICQSLGIDYLLVSDQDPAWQDEASWVWSARAAVAEPALRIVTCRDPAR